MRSRLLSSLCGLSIATAFSLAACTSQASKLTPSPAPSRAAGPGSGPVVYAAIGASETVGVGAPDRLRQAWPQLFFNSALPPTAVFYNFGFPGATTAEALDQEIPAALNIHPTLVTVWLNVNDLIAGVPAASYEMQLQQLVQALRQAGIRKILIASTPDLDRLPAYLACRAPSGSLHCPFAAPVPNAAQLNAQVEAYNRAIAHVAAQEGATVVDLQAQGEIPDVHPDWLSADGFHPNALGYAAIAAAFEAALAHAP